MFVIFTQFLFVLIDSESFNFRSLEWIDFVWFFDFFLFTKYNVFSMCYLFIHFRMHLAWHNDKQYKINHIQFNIYSFYSLVKIISVCWSSTGNWSQRNIKSETKSTRTYTRLVCGYDLFTYIHWFIFIGFI